ncbi:MAG TPA: glycerophosphodiester phosphodiesterase, partial [Candidatus Poseidoniales archaeon]
MSGTSEWKPAPENTLESLRHGIEMFDGIEFDVRLTADGQLVVHHDRTVSIPLDELKGHPTWVEEWA